MTTSNVNQHENTMTEESGGRTRTNGEWIDAVLEVLADARRRRIIQILRTRGSDAMPVPVLAEALATREPDSRDPARLTVSLRHVHLPKLDSTGIVEYTAERSQVRYTEPPLVEQLLDQL